MRHWSHSQHQPPPNPALNRLPPCPCPTLQLLEERDAELERMDTVMGGLREAAATRETALQEARLSLGDREAALWDKEARWGNAPRVKGGE